MRHKHCITWNVAEKLKKVINKKCTLQECEYVQQTDKRGNGENYGSTRNMERKLTNEENEKLTQQDMKYGEKH